MNQLGLGVERRATFSPDRKYRYSLWRKWTNGDRRCAFVLLNPSTADDERDDPTVRRCISFAKRWGYDALDVVNIFAYRSTDPSALYELEDPVGPENDKHIMAVTKAAAYVVAAWGNHGVHQERGARVLRQLIAAGVHPVAFKITKLGQPEHPLYQPDARLPVPLD